MLHPGHLYGKGRLWFNPWLWNHFNSQEVFVCVFLLCVFFGHTKSFKSRAFQALCHLHPDSSDGRSRWFTVFKVASTQRDFYHQQLAYHQWFITGDVPANLKDTGVRVRVLNRQRTDLIIHLSVCFIRAEFFLTWLFVSLKFDSLNQSLGELQRQLKIRIVYDRRKYFSVMWWNFKFK